MEIDLQIKAQVYLQQNISAYQREVEQILGSYIVPAYPYSTEKINRNLFPLNIKLDLQPQLLDKFLYPMVYNETAKNRIKTLFEKIFSGFQDHSGIEAIFQEIQKEVLAGNLKTLEKKAYIPLLSKLLCSLAKEAIQDNLSKIPMYKILKGYFQHVYYPVARDFNQSSSEQQEIIKKNWTNLFGFEGTKDLLNPKNIKNSDSWNYIAMQYMIGTLSQKIVPFIQVSRNACDKLYNLIGIEQDIVHKLKRSKNIIILPTKFAMKPDDIRKILTESSHTDINYADIPMKSIFFLSCKQGMGLPALNYESMKQEYRVNLKTVREKLFKGGPVGFLYHADKRFYTDWQIDITES